MEYISKEKLEENIDKILTMIQQGKKISDKYIDGYIDCCIDIKNIPTTKNVAPIKHGKWVDPEDDNGQIEWHCNMCHKVIYTLYGKPPFNYCPHCGARMNLED